MIRDPVCASSTATVRNTSAPPTNAGPGSSALPVAPSQTAPATIGRNVTIDTACERRPLRGTTSARVNTVNDA